jgi:hypothetical protein
MTIKNVNQISEPEVDEVRSAIEHRATWFYLLLDEAKKKGLNWEDFARQAILRCGCFHGEVKFGSTQNLKEFADKFANPLYAKIFEMDIRELTDTRFVVEFHYCPLINAWLKFTDNETEIDQLCDIAMEGDRGIVGSRPGYSMELADTIAKGGPACRIIITKE